MWVISFPAKILRPQKVLDLKEMVVGEMLRDRSLMVSLFQKCGKAEFKFLVNRYPTSRRLL